MIKVDEFNSKYTGEEIESKLDGAIVFNKDMDLSEEDKARAQANIGVKSGATGPAGPQGSPGVGITSIKIVEV